VKTSGDVMVWIESQRWIDTAGEALQRGVRQVFDALGPARRTLKNALHGTWLGHPVHPVLTDVPLGAWTATVVLDALEETRPRSGLAQASDVALAVGLAGAAGAAVTGLADWSETDGRPRKVGMVHAALNVSATLLFAGSLVCRRQGNREVGRALALTGYLVSVAAAYLGGELVFRDQIGVDHSAGAELPEEFTAILADTELGEGHMARARYRDTPILLARRDGRVSALLERCSHMGGPLAEGKLERGTVVCPWHGSRFELDTGAVLDGPSPFPQPCLEVRTRDGQIEVRKARKPNAIG